MDGSEATTIEGGSPAARRAALFVVALFLPYFALNLTYGIRWLVYAPGLALAAAAMAVLGRAGISREARYLAFRRPSALPVVAMVAVTVVYAAVAWTVGDRRPDFSLAGLLYFAPVSALAQELYFRGALPRALGELPLPWRLTPVAAQAGFFALWHVRGYGIVDPLQATALIVVAAAGGAAWAWAVRRDGTLWWVAAHHALLLVIARAPA